MTREKKCGIMAGRVQSPRLEFLSSSNVPQFFRRDFGKNYYLIFSQNYIIIIIQGKEKHRKIKIKKVLDKFSKIGYNKYIRKRERLKR